MSYDILKYRKQISYGTKLKLELTWKEVFLNMHVYICVYVNICIYMTCR